jgi:hypothetical protein
MMLVLLINAYTLVSLRATLNAAFPKSNPFSYNSILGTLLGAFNDNNLNFIRTSSLSPERS